MIIPPSLARKTAPTVYRGELNSVAEKNWSDQGIRRLRGVDKKAPTKGGVQCSTQDGSQDGRLNAEDWKALVGSYRSVVLQKTQGCGLPQAVTKICGGLCTDTWSAASAGKKASWRTSDYECCFARTIKHVPSGKTFLDKVQGGFVGLWPRCGAICPVRQRGGCVRGVGVALGRVVPVLAQDTPLGAILVFPPGLGFSTAARKACWNSAFSQRGGVQQPFDLWQSRLSL